MRKNFDWFLEAVRSMATDDWSQYSECARLDAGEAERIFIGPDGGEPDLAAAKQFCSVCPVQLECLEDAIRWDDEGVRGGFSRKERDSIVRRRKRYNKFFVYDLEEVNVGV